MVSAWTRGLALPVLTALMLVGMGAARAWAEPAARLHVREVRTHYVVRGTTERALLREMRRKGPRVSGRPALASTRMAARYRARMRGRAGRCRVVDLEMRVRFTIHLPRLRDATTLRRDTRRRWRAFSRMLLRHEKRHIAIWMRCVRQARRELPRLGASSCARLRGRLKQRYERIMARCNRAHDAFDKRERHAAPRDPFIRAAYSARH